MEGIDKLRIWLARHLTGWKMAREDYDEAIEMVDEIDREIDDMWHSLTIDAKSMTDENMAESGWVRLPLDADGVPIHVGERVQLIGNDLSTVSHMSLADDGWRVYMKYDGDLGTGSGEPSRIRHYYVPIIEDILADVVDRAASLTGSYIEDGMNEDEYIDLMSALVAEYAAKLQLAEGEDA